MRERNSLLRRCRCRSGHSLDLRDVSGSPGHLEDRCFPTRSYFAASASPLSCSAFCSPAQRRDLSASSRTSLPPWSCQRGRQRPGCCDCEVRWRAMGTPSTDQSSFERLGSRNHGAGVASLGIPRLWRSKSLSPSSAPRSYERDKNSWHRRVGCLRCGTADQ